MLGLSMSCVCPFKSRKAVFAGTWHHDRAVFGPPSIETTDSNTSACKFGPRHSVFARYGEKLADLPTSRFAFDTIYPYYFPQFALAQEVSRSLSWNPFLGTRVGEAANPGPEPPHRTFTFAILNPTVLTERQEEIIALGADAISLSETSATKAIQHEFTQFLRSTKYHVSWSPPVQPQKASINPLMADLSRRGEPLGTASLHCTPHRSSRNPFSTLLNDTLRVSQQIILVGHFEVLLVTAYFFAGRTAEVKNKSDLLLAQIYLHCAATNLPFIIAADFNNPVRDFPAYAAFRATRCQEAFHLAQCKFGQTLPPTCRGSTRNDSFIIHETLVPFVKDIWVGAPEVFPDHRPLFLQLQLPSKQVVCRSWFIPQTWGEIPLDPGTLEQCYTNNQARFTSRTDLNTEEKINRAFHRWSKGVENAVQKCVQIQHEQDPLHTPKPCLPQKFFGRGAPTKLVTHIYHHALSRTTPHRHTTLQLRLHQPRLNIRQGRLEDWFPFFARYDTHRSLITHQLSMHKSDKNGKPLDVPRVTAARGKHGFLLLNAFVLSPWNRQRRIG